MTAIEQKLSEILKDKKNLSNMIEENQRKKEQLLDEVFLDAISVLDAFSREEKVIEDHEWNQSEDSQKAIKRLLNAKKNEKYGLSESSITATAPSTDTSTNLNPEISKEQQIVEVEEDLARQLIPEKDSPHRKISANPLDPANLEHISRKEPKTLRQQRKEARMAEQAKAIENLLDLRDV